MQLDLESPVPLYHQIVAGLRYRVATGALAPGAALPPVRAAAKAWAVNMHTVRRAYRILADQGLLECRPHRGTRVRPDLATGLGPEQRFVHEVAQRAAEEFGWSVEELARALRSASSWDDPPTATVSVVECSTIQCADLAAQIEARWWVRAVPWCLAEVGRPPPGPVLSTFFHYNDIRGRWPELAPAVAFLQVQPAASVFAQLAAQVPAGARPIPVCEFDEAQARGIAADLAAGEGAAALRFEPRAVASANELLAGGAHPVVLFAPRVWAALTPAEREDPRALPATYEFVPRELDALAERRRWRRRAVGTLAPVSSPTLKESQP
ncbi:MAG: GntR family transcriptional regulator [Planctomycetota bacterium]